jgi:hypothetical protein
MVVNRGGRGQPRKMIGPGPAAGPSSANPDRASISVGCKEEANASLYPPRAGLNRRLERRRRRFGLHPQDALEPALPDASRYASRALIARTSWSTRPWNSASSEHPPRERRGGTTVKSRAVRPRSRSAACCPFPPAPAIAATVTAEMHHPRKPAAGRRFARPGARRTSPFRGTLPPPLSASSALYRPAAAGGGARGGSRTGIGGDRTWILLIVAMAFRGCRAARSGAGISVQYELDGRRIRRSSPIRERPSRLTLRTIPRPRPDS